MSEGLEFCPTLDALYRDPPPGSGALSTRNNLLAIRRLMLAGRPERTLEVGMAEGGSALAISASHRDNGAAAAAQHVAIDPYAVQVWKRRAMERLEQAGVAGYVAWTKAFSSEALPKLLAEGASFGLIYIDGSHEYEDVFCDYYFSRRLLAPKGYLLFDDSSDRAVQKVIRHVRTVPALRLVDMAEYRDVSGLDGAKRRLASLAGRTQLTVFQRMG